MSKTVLCLVRWKRFLLVYIRSMSEFKGPLGPGISFGPTPVSFSLWSSQIGTTMRFLLLCSVFAIFVSGCTVLDEAKRVGTQLLGTLAGEENKEAALPERKAITEETID